MKSSIIILAAGASTRMGQSKQLLKVDELSLLRKIVDTALQTDPQSVIVVLGADEENHRKEIEGLKVQVVSNPQWKSGMGSSVHAGITHLLKHNPHAETVIITVCDQPALTSDHLLKLNTLFNTSHKLIVASQYAGIAGVPALFHKNLFQQLLDLSKEEGARKIIQQHKDDTVTVDFPAGAIDLDTPEDYQRFTGE